MFRRRCYAHPRYTKIIVCRAVRVRAPVSSAFCEVNKSLDSGQYVIYMRVLTHDHQLCVHAGDVAGHILHVYYLCVNMGVCTLLKFNTWSRFAFVCQQTTDTTRHNAVTTSHQPEFHQSTRFGSVARTVSHASVINLDMTPENRVAVFHIYSGLPTFNPFSSVGCDEQETESQKTTTRIHLIQQGSGFNTKCWYTIFAF